MPKRVVDTLFLRELARSDRCFSRFLTVTVLTDVHERLRRMVEGWLEVFLDRNRRSAERSHRRASKSRRALTVTFSVTR